MMKSKRKVFTGQVIGDKMDKTVVVAITWHQSHPIYRKSVRRITKAYAHDEHNTCRLGDLVQIEEARPLSKIKRWRVIDILSQQDLPDLSAPNLDEVIPDLEILPEATVSTLEESVDSSESNASQEEEPSAEISEESIDSSETDASEDDQLQDESPSDEDEVSK